MKQNNHPNAVLNYSLAEIQSVFDIKPVPAKITLYAVTCRIYDAAGMHYKRALVQVESENHQQANEAAMLTLIKTGVATRYNKTSLIATRRACADEAKLEKYGKGLCFVVSAEQAE